MIRKNIDLPERTILKLQQLAAADNRKLKPFIEMVLINFAEKNSLQKHPQLSIIDTLPKSHKIANHETIQDITLRANY